MLIISINFHENLAKTVTALHIFVQTDFFKALLDLEKKLFLGVFIIHVFIWAWLPSWSMDHNHLNNWISHPKEAPYDI